MKVYRAEINTIAPLAKGSLMQTPHKGEICVRPAGPLLRNLGDLAHV